MPAGAVEVAVDGLVDGASGSRGGLSRFAREAQVRFECARAVRALLGDHVIVLDVEPQGARVVEIGMVRVSFGHVEAVESFLLDPGVQVLGARPSTKVKLDKAELVRGAGSFADQAVHFYNFVAGHRLFAGWSPGNDAANLTSEFALAGLPHAEMTWVDVQDLFRQATGERGKVRLVTAYERMFGSGWAQPHYALDDAVHTAHLLGVVCRDLVAGQAPPEVVRTSGWLGRDWLPMDVISEPKRRFSLPDPPRVPYQQYLGKVNRWRRELGLAAAVRPECEESGFSQVRLGLDRREAMRVLKERALVRAQVRRASGVCGPLLMPLPLADRD